MMSAKIVQFPKKIVPSRNERISFTIKDEVLDINYIIEFESETDAEKYFADQGIE